tara:strand:+ start:149 stop:646 length:498 start_codon:yes stop_codon:yes gene_type:complete
METQSPINESPINKEFSKNTALEIIKKAQLSEEPGNIEFVTQLLIGRCNRGMREIFHAKKEIVIGTFKSFNLPRRAKNTPYRVILLDVINKQESEWLRENDYYIDQLNASHPHEKAPKVKLELPKVETTKVENIFDKVDSFAQFLKENNDARNYWGSRYEPFLSR